MADLKNKLSYGSKGTVDSSNATGVQRLQLQKLELKQIQDLLSLQTKTESLTKQVLEIMLRLEELEEC